MLNFFRKLRKTMIRDGQAKRYALYALGEILLVMIGILLALQVNNWNEKNKSFKRQSAYLQQIHSEMSSNLESVQGEQEKMDGILNGLRSFVSLYANNADDVSEDEISTVWGSVFSKSAGYKYENGVLLGLLSSGGIKEIVNDSIRNKLMSWEARIKKLTLQEVEFNEYLKKGNDFMEENGGVRTIIDHRNGNEWWGIEKQSSPRSNTFLLKSARFENILVFAILTGQTLKSNNYSDLEHETMTLLSQIEKEPKIEIK